jgi:hypothetical protein
MGNKSGKSKDSWYRNEEDRYGTVTRERKTVTRNFHTNHNANIRSLPSLKQHDEIRPVDVKSHANQLDYYSEQWVNERSVQRRDGSYQREHGVHSFEFGEKPSDSGYEVQRYYH